MHVVCQPKSLFFHCSGYLHGHVSYLDEECNSCLLLLTVDRDTFFTLSDCKSRILEVSAMFTRLDLAFGKRGAWVPSALH
jgi:hypothetical protein